MPDIFDTISLPSQPQTQTPAEQPAEDIFDRVHAQMSAAPKAAPTAGDAASAAPANVFQQAAANAGPSTAKSVERAAGDYIRGHNIRTPEMISATYDAFRQNAAGNTTPVHAPTVQEDAQRHAAENGFFTNFGNKLGRDLAKPYEGAEGLISPETALRVRERNDLQYPSAGAGEKVGGYVSGFVNSPYAITPVGRVLSAAEAAGNSRINTAQARANGADMGGAEEVENAALHGALDLGQNVAANKLFGKTVGSLGKQFAPQIADAALNGEAGAVGKTLFKQLAAKVGLEAAGNDVIGRGHTLLRNAADRITTNPNQSLTEGQGIENEINAAITTGAFNLAGARGAIHEAKAGAVEHVANEAPVLRDAAASRIFGSHQGDVFDHAAGHVAASPDRPVAPDAHAAEGTTPAVQSDAPTAAESLFQSARVREYQRLQQWAKENGHPVPEMTPDLHPEEIPAGTSPDANALAAARPAVEGKTTEQTAANTLGNLRARQAQAKGEPAGAKNETDISGAFATAKNAASDGFIDSMWNRVQKGEPIPRMGALENRLREAQKAGTLTSRDDVAAMVSAKSTPAESEDNVFKRLASDEAGGLKQTGAFVNQDVLPAANRVLSAGKQIATAIDRDMDLGLTTTPKGKQTALDLRKMQGDAEAAGHAFESQVAPYREHVPTFSDNAKDALIWADQVEASGTAPNKESQPAADALLAMRKQNAVRAKKLGINNLDEEGFGLARLFKPADGKVGKGNSLAGTNKPFYHQKYDTFSDSYAAAAKSGLVPMYSNPLDMQIARQYEVERNLAARENIRKADNEGTIKWFPDGTKPDAGFDTKLTDPLLARETRRLAAPAWMVGKLSQLNHFDALKYLDEIKPKLVDVKPGEDPPQGYSFTGKELAGTFHGPADTARFFNNAMNHGIGDPIATLGSKIARSALQMRYLMSASHGAAAIASNAGFHLGQAMKGVMAGDATGAGQSMLDALNPLSGMKRGHELRQELENPGTHPHLSDVAQRVQSINPGLKLRSVLDRSTYDNAIAAFKNDNPVGGTVKMVGAVLKMVGDVTYNRVLPDIMAGGLRNVAEADVRAGKSEPEGRANLAQAYDTLAHLIGHHVRGNEFSAGVEKTVGRILFPAYDLMRGQVENVAGAVTGRNPHALAALAGMAAVTAVTSGIAQMAYTYATTGNVVPPSDPRDFWNPRTGRKDVNGHEERLTLPGMMPFILKMVGAAGGTQGITNEMHGRLNPLISGGAETWQNRDFQGNQIRPTGGSVAGNFLKGAAHTVRGTLPIAAASQFDNPTGEPMSWDEHVGKAIGAQYGHPVTSDAEQTAYDILDKKSGGEGRTPEKEQTRQNERRWVQRIRAGEDENAILDEMEKDPQMSPVRAKSVFRRAAEKQGLVGLISDSQLQAPELAKVWGKASDDEKAAMHDAIGKRLTDAGHRLASMSANDREAWRNLYETVKVSAGE
jgi:hypothetical protein